MMLGDVCNVAERKRKGSPWEVLVELLDDIEQSELAKPVKRALRTP